MKRIAWVILTIAAFLTACTNDGYETGDGKFSFLTSDFVEVFSNSQSMLTHAIDDNDKDILFKAPQSCLWAETADSTYRALLYYNVTEGEQAVEVYTISPVLVLRKRNAADVSEIHTDPLFVRSAWIGKNRKYLNLGIGVKSGTTEDPSENLKQTIGIVCDEVITRSDGSKTHRLRLLHNQNGVPEYYTNWLYVSVPLDGIGENDEIELTVNTYQGEQTIKR